MLLQTNNPQLWEVAWWNKEYVTKFDNFKSSDPYYDLESYMNWEPNSWYIRQRFNNSLRAQS